MWKSRSPAHRRTRSDTVSKGSKIDVSPSPEGQYAEGQIVMDNTAFRRSSPEEKSGGGGFVVRRQMKQVVGDLVTVLGELRTVVGDIRTLVSQIDIVTHKIDQSISSDQSDKSAASSGLKAATKSTSSGSYELRQACPRRSSRSEDDLANVCDVSCFGSQESKDKHARAAGLSNAGCHDDRQGERLSNHDRVYVAYKPRFCRHSIDKCLFSSSKKTPGPLTPPDKDRRQGSVPRSKASQGTPGNYITHIYENIRAFTKKPSPESHKKVAPSVAGPHQGSHIPARSNRCFYSSLPSPKPTRTQANQETFKLLRSPKKKSQNVYVASAKAQQEYSGLYEREMEEKLELEFDDSLELLDTLADIQTVDNDFDQVFDDYDLATPVRDSYPIDMIRKHADVVAWAQTAWPAARYAGNSLDCSDDPVTEEEETDAEWYEEKPVIPKSINSHFVNFSWRPVIEP